MFHTSMNNFRSYYNGYPFKSNVIDEIQAVGEASDDTIISGAYEQINAILTMKPFDPEEFGFRVQHQIGKYYIHVNGVEYILRQTDSDKYGHWELEMTADFVIRDTESRRGDAEVIIPLYIPNDLAGRIILTSLGIVKRRDLDEEGKGCPDDSNLDGICELCENSGRCINKE